MKLVFLLLLLFFPVAQLHAADTIDENALFSEPASVVTSSLTQDVAQELDRESVAFSGELHSRSTYGLSRDWLEDKGPFSANRLTGYSDGNLFLDVRLKKGIKAFLNLSAASTAQGVSGNTTLVALREFFLDVNLNKVVYLRTGKQVLQWGRNYFWNPTDLINIQRKNFLNLNVYREGVYGTKLHIPFGAGKNIYTFLDMTDADNLDQLALAAKYEFLWDNSEIALSGWKKKGLLPVYGLDFSTRCLNVDIKGELALSYGDNDARLRRDSTGALGVYRLANTWVPKASLGFSRYFDWELKDRISVTAELYYNRNGYIDNPFSDVQRYAALQALGLARTGDMARYYSALFVTVDKYPLTDMSVYGNTLSNWCDHSLILAAGVNYALVDHLTLGMGLNLFLGPPAAEFTINGDRMSIDLTTTLIF